jgi:hypothetical protein
MPIFRGSAEIRRFLSPRTTFENDVNPRRKFGGWGSLSWSFYYRLLSADCKCLHSTVNIKTVPLFRYVQLLSLLLLLSIFTAYKGEPLCSQQSIRIILHRIIVSQWTIVDCVKYTVFLQLKKAKQNVGR